MNQGFLKKTMSTDRSHSAPRLATEIQHPLVFEPVLSRRRWGGRKLGERLGKPIGPEDDYAESWEVADHSDGQSVVLDGPFQGSSLSKLLEEFDHEILGRAAGLIQFPLLIKYLDANDWLSLQVHPNDQQARQFNPAENGKTEAWVILDAEPGSEICCGLKAGVTAQDLRDRLADGTVEDVLHIFPAVAGDCVFVPAGTVHAIGPGILLAEVQQQSNLTFRLHDWNRMGAGGKPRELHIEESIECIDFCRGPVDPATSVELSRSGYTFEEIVRCPYFVIRRHYTVDEFTVPLDDRFRILMVISGQANVAVQCNERLLSSGQTTLIPAQCESVNVTPVGGRATVLEVLQP